MSHPSAKTRPVATLLILAVLLALPIGWVGFRADKAWRDQVERSYVLSMIPTYRDFRLP